jgi:hypothetical protein
MSKDTKHQVQSGKRPLPIHERSEVHPLTAKIRELRVGQWFVVDPRDVGKAANERVIKGDIQSKVNNCTSWAKRQGVNKRWRYYRAREDATLGIADHDIIIFCEVRDWDAQ